MPRVAWLSTDAGALKQRAGVRYQPPKPSRLTQQSFGTLPKHTTVHMGPKQEDGFSVTLSAPVTQLEVDYYAMGLHLAPDGKVERVRVLRAASRADCADCAHEQGPLYADGADVGTVKLQFSMCFRDDAPWQSSQAGPVRADFPKEMFGVVVQLHNPPEYQPVPPVILPFLSAYDSTVWRQARSAVAANSICIVCVMLQAEHPRPNRFPYVYTFTVSLVPRKPTPTRFQCTPLASAAMPTGRSRFHTLQRRQRQHVQSS